MPLGDGLKTRKTFPDIKSAGGRYSGLVTGLKTAINRGDVNRQNQAAQYRQSMQDMQSQRTYDLANKRLDIEERKASGGKEPKWDTILNNANKSIMEANKAIIKNNPNQPLYELMSLDEVQASRGKPMFKSVSMGAGLAPQGRNFWGKARDLVKGVTGFAEGGIVNKPQIAMVGEEGKEYIVPEKKLDPNTKAELDRILGASVQNNAPQPGAKTGISTEDLIATLDDYAPEDADQAIADLIKLDQSVRQPGVQLPENIDYQAFGQAFLQKFGEEAFRKLEAQITGKA